MPQFHMTKSFKVIPEGEHIFRIYAVDFDEEFGRITVKMVNAKGFTHSERYTIKNKEGEAIDGAMNAFSYLARVALNEYDRDDIDTDELVDHYIKATIVHKKVPSTKNEGEFTTFANIAKREHADGFDETPVERALTLGHEQKNEPMDVSAPAETSGGLDLDALLN